MIQGPLEDQSSPGSPTTQLIPRSVWDWSAQFHDVDIGLFLNPLFSVTCRVAAYRQRHGIPPSVPPPTPVKLVNNSKGTSNSNSPARWIPSPAGSGSGERPRRNSISGTLPRSIGASAAEYGAENSGTDTLGESAEVTFSRYRFD